MKTQTSRDAEFSIKTQNIMGYEDLRRELEAGSVPTTKKDIRNVIARAKRYSKCSDLRRSERENMANIAKTWQKFL